MISNALLAKWTVSLDSSCCSRDQNHSQYAPLKITCIKEVTCFFSKIKSLRVHQIAQIRAVALTKINNLSFLFTPVNQYPSIWDIDLGGVNPVAIWTIRQIILACWQSKNRCLIVSLQLQKQHFVLLVQFLFAKLSLVKITPRWRYQMKIFIFSRILSFQINLFRNGVP